MSGPVRHSRLAIISLLAAMTWATPLAAETGSSDSIADILARPERGGRFAEVQSKTAPAARPAAPAAAPELQPAAKATPVLEPPAETLPADPRTGDPTYDQAQRLMRAIDG